MRHKLVLKLWLVLASAAAAWAQAPSGHINHRVAAMPASLSADSVRIVPTTLAADNTSIDIANDRWRVRGYDLRSLIAEVYHVDPRRIDLPDSADAAARYDVSLALPSDVSDEAIDRALQQALQRRFKLSITPQSRAMEVYVITAPHGAGPALRPHRAAAAEEPQQITIEGRMCPGIFSGGISAIAGTVSELRRTLEPYLDRLLVDEANLAGSYDFHVGEFNSKEEFFELLRDQLGLVVVPTQREVVVLTVRPAQG
jgi:uncharacterized protein (TIGR03435 family)